MALKGAALCWWRWLAEQTARGASAARRLREAAGRRGCPRAAGAACAGAGVVAGLLLLCVLASLWAPAEHMGNGGCHCHECWGCEPQAGVACACASLPLLLAEEGAGSVCGRDADRRGPHQKVAAFSFYGNDTSDRGYFQGISENAALVSQLLPGWVMRVYHEAPPSTHNGSAAAGLARLRERFPHLDLCDAAGLPRYGDLSGSSQMLWRLLPAADPLVDVFISRDLDSRLSSRELAAVHQWLESGLSFHVMRDNLQHHVPVMGGMWGARTGRRRAQLRTLVDVVVSCQWGAVRNDQALLAEFIWPIMRGDVLQHDSYFCELPGFNGHGHMAPFPTKRQGRDFVGNPKPSNGTARLEAHPCPSGCRPLLHPDWTYC